MYMMIPEMNRLINRTHYEDSPFDLFDRFFSAPSVRMPRADVTETDNEYRVEMDMPGVKREDIAIEVNDDVLTISCDTHSENDENGNDNVRYITRERVQSFMKRSFSLEGIDQNNITASMNNGTLTVVLPKEQPEAAPAPRRIEIAG